MKGRTDQAQAFNIGRCPHGFRQYVVTGSATPWHSSPRDPRKGEAFAELGGGIRIFRCDAAASPTLAEVLA